MKFIHYLPTEVGKTILSGVLLCVQTNFHLPLPYFVREKQKLCGLPLNPVFDAIGRFLLRPSSVIQNIQGNYFYETSKLFSFQSCFS